MTCAADILQKHAAQKAAGLLTSMDRTKITVLRNIITSPLTSKRAKADAAAGLAQWEARAVARGHASLDAWLALR